MRKLMLAAALLAAVPMAGFSTMAQAAAMTTTDTDIGALIDSPQAKAVLDKYLPGFTANDQIQMARSMTLRAIQQYSPDTITDDKLAKIDADLAALDKK